MTAGAKTSCRPARTALISSMAARMALDIAPRAIFGKLEMADLRALKADREFAAAALTACFKALLTAFRKCLVCGLLRNARPQRIERAGMLPARFCDFPQ